MPDVKIREFYNMDPLYNCTPIKELIVAIFITREKMK